MTWESLIGKVIKEVKREGDSVVVTFDDDAELHLDTNATFDREGMFLKD